MKKIILPLLLAVASVLPMHAQTILVVDVNGVFNSLIEVKSELAKINSDTESYKTYLNTLGQGLQDSQNKANALTTQANNPANLQDSRDAYRSQAQAADAEVEKKKTDIQSFYSNSNDVITKRQQALVTTELDKIKAAAQEIATKRKASLVLNSSALNMLSPVIFSDKSSMDITDDVVKSLNAAATAAAPAASAPATTPAPAMAKPAATK